MEEKNLAISGYRGQPVPNTFTRQLRETDALAVLLPGFGYNNDMPVLFYPAQIVLARGADLLRLNPGYSHRPEFTALSDEGQQAWLDADARAGLSAALTQRPYKRLVVVGKSLGTMAMAGLLEHFSDLPKSYWVWLTPVLNDSRLREQILRHKPRSLFVIGTADHYYAPDTLQHLAEATESRPVLIEGANHSLEIKGDIQRSIQVLGRVMQDVEAFLAAAI